jgi:hypothetical protein
MQRENGLRIVAERGQIMPFTMKHTFTVLKHRIRLMLDQSVATKDRPANFQITVITFLAMATTCITYCIFQMVS